MSGLVSVTRRREKDMRTPTLMITSLNTNQNEIESFKHGANLFHRKPINFALLESQIKALLKLHEFSPTIRIGDLVIEPQKRIVKKAGQLIKLTPKEFKLFVALATVNGDVLSRQNLLAQTFKGVRDLEESSIDTMVCRIRKKIGKYKGDEVIETVHGVGYRLSLKYFEDTL